MTHGSGKLITFHMVECADCNDTRVLTAANRNFAKAAARRHGWVEAYTKTWYCPTCAACLPDTMLATVTGGTVSV